METKKSEVHIYCDGHELPLVPYLAELFGKTIGTMVGTLKGAESAREIAIRISVPPPDASAGFGK